MKPPSRGALPYEARWEADGDDRVGLVAAASGPALAPAVRELGGTCFRWDVVAG